MIKYFRSISKNFLIFIIISVFLLVSFSVFLIYRNNNLAIAGDNFGGWSYNNFFGWISESCNNLYGTGYEDYCGLNMDPILDINFDSDDIDIDNGKVKDNTGSFNGKIFNFIETDIRNGGKNKTTGLATKNSSFDNSLYFNGIDSYINFGAHKDFSFNGNDFSISLWFKIDEGLTEDSFLFSNGDDINKRYHCWIDKDYYLSCFVKNKKIKSTSSININKWTNITIVHEEKSFLMYLDGFLIDNTSIGASALSNSKELILGAFGDQTQNFKGELDEFRLFDKSLNIDQVLHNISHNSNYLLDIDNETGEISGWVWSNGIGWICFGKTCEGLAPDKSEPEAKLYWSSQGGETYPYMISGWANAISFNDAGQEKYQDMGWISLQSEDILNANYDEYSSCVSCGFRDEEDDLVLYFKMDEDSGELAIDSSGFDNNAQLKKFEEESWTEDGRINNCLNFDGIDDFVELDIGDVPELEMGYNDFSVEVWVKNEELGHLTDNLTILGGYAEEEWELYFDSKDNLLVFDIFDNKVQGKITDISDWSHIVVNIDRDSNLEMYVNNQEYSGDNISEFSEKYINDKAILIGNNYSDSFWDGAIDIVRIYTKVLSKDAVAHNYEFPEKRFCSACLNQILSKAESSNICYDCERCKIEKGVTNCELCSGCREYGLTFDTNTANIKGFAWGGFSVDDELVGLGWFKFSPSFGAGLYRSYVSSKYGDIYSKANIGSSYSVIPPIGYFNATYMIQANGHIMNWVSTAYEANNNWLMSADSGNPLSYEYPKLENDYGNVLGNLDYVGLINGRYGEVKEGVPNEGLANYDVCLDNNVFFKKDSFVLTEKAASGIAYRFQNCSQGAGTIIIDGDLSIEADIQYDDTTFSGESSGLASVAWVIKGDLRISPKVRELAGTFIVLGKDDTECGSVLESPKKGCGAIFTCDANESECGKQLEVSGQFLAKNFRFQRTFRSLEGQLREAAEEIIYDGRNIINPPPGLGDVLKILPTWNQIAPY
jgi:hypothetical protein